jgi:hypothetical protein
MQGKILFRNQPRRLDMFGKYGNVVHEKIRRTGGCGMQRIFLSPYRLEDFSLDRLEDFLSR